MTHFKYTFIFPEVKYPFKEPSSRYNWPLRDAASEFGCSNWNIHSTDLENSDSHRNATTMLCLVTRELFGTLLA